MASGLAALALAFSVGLLSHSDFANSQGTIIGIKATIDVRGKPYLNNIRIYIIDVTFHIRGSYVDMNNISIYVHVCTLCCP